MKETNNPDIYYGTATVKADGKEAKLLDVVFRPSGITMVPVNNGKGAYPEEHGAMVRGRKYLATGDNLEEILSQENVTIVVKTNVKKTFMMSNAWRATLPEISKDGFDLEYNAAESEIMNG